MALLKLLINSSTLITWTGKLVYHLTSETLIVNTVFISSTQPPCEVTEGSPHTVVYAQVDPVKQNGPQPPTNDDPVQYAQIEHQDKL